MQQLANTYQRIKHQSSVELRWQQYFEQDDIEPLAQSLLSLDNTWRVLEKVEGMDRVYYRLLLGPHTVQLHFEVYSQSTWFEGENISSEHSLNELIHFI